jgi:hypothetical protein
LPSRVSEIEEHSPKVGNRYDTSKFGTIYFGTTRECCYGETLARLRPDPTLAALVAGDWSGPFMAPGQVPADWRERRTLVNVVVSDGELFLDVESMATRETLRKVLSLGLAALGYDDLDVSIIRSGDRRVTRLVAQWAYQAVDAEGYALFAGLRYVSRLNSCWECWAAFDDVAIARSVAQPIEPDDPELISVCSAFGIHVH